MRYSRTLAQLTLFACHLADLKEQYSVNFDKMHGLSVQSGTLARCVMDDHRSEASREAILRLLQGIIEYRGKLMESAQDQYLVFHFLALKNLRHDGGFPPPIDVTQALAHLQWCFRLVMFNKLRRKLKAAASNAVDNEARGSTAWAKLEKSLVRETLGCLHIDACTQMGTIHSMKGILRHHAEQHPRPPLARWDDLTFTRLYCEGKQFTLDAFRSMNQNLLERSRTLLQELMFGENATSWLKIPDFIHDREGKCGDLYSFLMDRDNGFDYLNSTFAQGMLKHFVVGNVNGKLQLSGVGAYLSKCRAMLDLIAAMMHVTGGGAPRAEEAVQTRILEGKEGKRNLFHMRGKIGWVLQYNKAKAQKVREQCSRRRIDLKY
ncbi:hypothetical protein QFC19_001441 [Naganishia cerealis]|uniref:Uncharacterized protein n=1 Tax=Naganishia cerealis TaxID=610337 RepID=A0ACC2WJ81_9TREE|nr:hypothetical protein QFC19_001441 [Naganishia cerealis]